MVFRDLAQLRETAVAAARAGAEQLMPFWRSLAPSQVREKARNDLVSEADRASERAIVGVVRSAFPEHGIVAEESGRVSDGGGEQPIWLIDPLDGTTNFVFGFPHFAVSIGVVIERRPAVGVVLDPVKGDLFTAVQGQGAWRNGVRMTVSRRRALDGALLTTGFPFRAHRLLDYYLAIFRDLFLRVKSIRRPGAAALDLAYTAGGIFDGFFELGLAPWDMAAGALLVREAGGTVTDLAGGDRFLETGDVLCGPPGVHREILDVVASLEQKR